VRRRLRSLRGTNRLSRQEADLTLGFPFDYLRKS
jgi:hypothetical protein